MPDLLVKLYALPDPDPGLAALSRSGVETRRAMAYEKHLVSAWVKRAFGEGWASECEAAFSNKPVSCFIAERRRRLVGFACYDATCKDFFGPAGVAESQRGQGVGAVLLLRCLRAMADEGYAYAIIGGAGSAGFYERVAGAIEIPGSSPGIYPPKLEEDAEGPGGRTPRAKGRK